MGDDLNKTYTWICPECGHRYEETDLGQLEVRIQMHKCKAKLKFICAVCKQETPHFKGLLDHYQEKHPEFLRRYEIKNTPSRVTLLTHSPNADTAIKAQKWDKEDCKIKEVE